MKLSVPDIAIIGAGGHARALVRLMLGQNIRPARIVDETFVQSDAEEFVLGIPVNGQPKDLDNDQDIVIAIGDPRRRLHFYVKYRERILENNLIHESVQIANSAGFGGSNQIMPEVYIGALANIGDNNIIYTRSTIEHESVIGDHCFVSINVTISGRVRIGDRCYIGAGATLIDKIAICDDAIIGAGATVIRDINEPGIYVGTPAKRIK